MGLAIVGAPATVPTLDPTPLGYSHGTGVSSGGLATAVLGVVARDTPGVHGVVWGLRRYGAPWECYTGLRGQL